MTNTSNLHAQDVESRRRDLEDQLQAAYDAMSAQGGQVKCDEGQTWRVGEKEGEGERALEWDGQKQVERGDGEDEDVIELGLVKEVGLTTHGERARPYLTR